LRRLVYHGIFKSVDSAGPTFRNFVSVMGTEFALETLELWDFPERREDHFEEEFVHGPFEYDTDLHGFNSHVRLLPPRSTISCVTFAALEYDELSVDSWLIVENLTPENYPNLRHIHYNTLAPAVIMDNELIHVLGEISTHVTHLHLWSFTVGYENLSEDDTMEDYVRHAFGAFLQNLEVMSFSDIDQVTDAYDSDDELFFQSLASLMLAAPRLTCVGVTRCDLSDLDKRALEYWAAAAPGRSLTDDDLGVFV
jgi:hypothetical protein